MGTVNIDAIVARLYELEEENSRLKALLSKHGIPYKEILVSDKTCNGTKNNIHNITA